MPASNVACSMVSNILCIYFQASLKTSKELTASVEEQLDQFQKKLREKEVRKILFKSAYRTQS